MIHRKIKAFFYAVAAIFLLCAGCGHDASPDDVSVRKKLNIVAASETKVQLNGELATVWTEGDCISVFNMNDGNGCWKFDGKTGDTRGTVSPVTAGEGSTNSKLR